ncbi:hypothetical protein HPB52_016513 [Rhipicephalus sanguineus]|uniref:CCHC-type domain-containing protein n=1 Tax=Rhipicephalus sanguineus TaxID=34632 RepID=A0A9D4YQH9_RHISA|nr:hypothetical protein HPB52_016513 [Rhipicephalus sanguineus]
MPKKLEDAKQDPPKAGRVRRQAATAAVAADDVPAPSTETPAAKPIAPKPTAARKSRKVEDATQPATETPSTSKAVPTKARRVSRRKRSRSSSPSGTVDTASDAPRRRGARRRTEGTANLTDGGDTGSANGETITTRDLLQVLQEKDRLLSTLLERLSVASAAQPQPAPTFQVIPDLIQNISAFDGSEDAPSAREWIDNIRRTSILHGWPAAHTLETAKARYVGAARDWYRSKSSQITSWEEFEFEVRFRRTFVSQTRVAKRWRRLQERVPQRNESTTAYFHSKVRLCHEVNLDFNDTREQVLTELRSRELCTMLLGRTHDDDDDLLHDILEFECIERERRSFLGSERSLPMTRELTIDSNQGTDRRQGLPPVSQHGERKCYNCNFYGQIARDCPEPKRPLKYQRCQATDHTHRNCKSLSRNESNVVGEALPCTEAGHVLLKEVIFNDDFALVGLIDTGTAARCCIEMVQEPTPTYGFGNMNVPATRSLGHCKAKISIDGIVVEKISVQVVPDDAQCVDLLVGRTFTDLPFVTYAKVGSTFRFYHLNDCPFVDLATLEQKSNLKLRAREHEIRKDTVNFITMSTDHSVISPVVSQHCGRDVLRDMKRGKSAAALDDPEQRAWNVHLKQVECSLNNAINRSTGKSPLEMLHRYKPSFYGGALQQLADMKNPWQPPQEFRAQVRQQLLDEEDSAKQSYDRRHYPARINEVGEVVFMSKTPEHTGNPTKPQPKYRGPLAIRELLPVATVPKEVHDVVARGPKFAFERKRSALELLSLVRQVYRLVPEAEVERCASEGVDALSRHKSANMKLPLEKTVTFLKDSGFSFFLPKRKEALRFHTKAISGIFTDRTAASGCVSPLLHRRPLLAPASQPAATQGRAGSSGSRADGAKRPEATPPCRRSRKTPSKISLRPGTPAAKRPRGRPPKAVSVEPLAPKPTAARKTRKVEDAAQPATETPSNSKAVPTKAQRVSRRKRSRSSSPSSTVDTASDAPKRRSARRKVSRGRSRHSSRSRHGGRARKGRSRQSSASRSERSHGRRRSKSRRHARSRSSSSATTIPSKRGKKRRHARSHSSSRHGGRHVKVRKSLSSRSSSRRGRRMTVRKTTKHARAK